tara:strand:- start:3487 stop:3675 length:189 start_codon:yes stop_codon:yes gene_type:complete
MDKNKHSQKLIKLMEDLRTRPNNINRNDIKSLNDEEQKILSKYLTELMIETSSMKREEEIKN